MSYNCLQCNTAQTLNLTRSILSDDCNNPWRTINGTYHIFSFQKQNLFKSLFLERCQAPGVWIFWCYSALLTRMISKSLSKKSLLEKSIGQESTCVLEQRWDFYWALEIEYFWHPLAFGFYDQKKMRSPKQTTPGQNDCISQCPLTHTSLNNIMDI